jgi:hypothetical protein
MLPFAKSAKYRSSPKATCQPADQNFGYQQPYDKSPECESNHTVRFSTIECTLYFMYTRTVFLTTFCFGIPSPSLCRPVLRDILLVRRSSDLVSAPHCFPGEKRLVVVANALTVCCFKPRRCGRIMPVEQKNIPCAVN